MPLSSQVSFTCKTRPVQYFSSVMSRFHGVCSGHLRADTSAGALPGSFHRGRGGGIDALCSYSSVNASCGELLLLLAGGVVEFLGT